MKKISIIISLVLLLNCFCFGFSLNNDKKSAYALESFSNSSSATNENDSKRYLVNNYATYYFGNLTDNYGYNLLSSCGYVAIAMLLSYYDTYWNDDIIPECYDEPSILSSNKIGLRSLSPGITPDKRLFQDTTSLSIFDNYNAIQTNNGTDTYKAIDYYNDIVLPNFGKYFHLNLLYIGKTQGVYNINSADPFVTNLNQIKAILNYYLYTYLNFTEEQISYTYVTDGLFSKPTRSFTIEKVKQGIPVLFRAKNSGGEGGHAFIVYDYDEENDELYAHMGWYPNRIEHVKLSTTNYNSTLWDATVLNVNLPHKHSNNYVYTDASGVTTTHCPCELAIHPAHVHDYTHKYIRKDENTHYAYCICGLATTNNHSHTNEYYRIDSTSHYEYCICGDGKNCEHSYELNCEFNDSDTHYAYCVCGGYGTERHKYTDSYVRKDGISHYSYCECGASITSAHVLTGSETSLRQYCLLCKGLADIGAVRPYAKNAEYVTENGSYILPNGITVLADEDVEAYLNGTLRFYKNGEVSA